MRNIAHGLGHDGSLQLLTPCGLRAVHSGPGSRFLNIHQEITLDVDQFYGIEVEEFPSQIAQVALWLVDHQMNLKVSEEFGMYFARIPLTSTPHIIRSNATRIDWNDVVPAERVSYIISNPPFSGAMVMGDPQREDVASVFLLDEAVPLGVVEPLDLALNAHCLPLPCAPALRSISSGAWNYPSVTPARPGSRAQKKAASAAS
jgi:hypothetical protein